MGFQLFPGDLVEKKKNNPLTIKGKQVQQIFLKTTFSATIETLQHIR